MGSAVSGLSVRIMTARNRGLSDLWWKELSHNQSDIGKQGGQFFGA